MKQKMKKVVAAVLAAVMVLAMSVTAFATEPEEGGTITINVNKDNTLKDRTFYAYKLYDLKKVGTEEYSYTEATPEATAAVAAAIKDTDGSTQTSADDQVAWLRAQLNEDGTIKDTDTMMKFARILPSKLTAPAPEKQVKGGEESSLSISVDSMGYYVVVETTADTDGKAISLAMLKTAEPNATVNIKSKAPTVDKEITGEGENEKESTVKGIGDTVNYSIKCTFPDKGSLATFTDYQYVLTDTLSKGLKYNPESLHIELADGTVLVEDTDYELTTKPVTPDGNGETVITIKFGKKMEEPEDRDLKEIIGEKTVDSLTVTYNATVTTAAEVRTDLPNSAVINYSNNPSKDTAKNTLTDKVVVKTYGFKVFKHNADNTGLKGAEFELFTDNGNGKAGTPVNVKLVSDSNYQVSPEASSNKVISGADGYLNVDGLDDAKYVLVETKAPTGYNKTTSPILVDLTNEEDATEADVVKVLNNTGATLPETGGVGTTIIYVVGILAMAAAVFYFVMNKKSKEVK